MEAETFGSLMMLAFGERESSPSVASVSSATSPGGSASGNCARIRAATEMSHASTRIPAGPVKRLTIGSSE